MVEGKRRHSAWVQGDTWRRQPFWPPGLVLSGNYLISRLVSFEMLGGCLPGPERLVVHAAGSGIGPRAWPGCEEAGSQSVVLPRQTNRLSARSPIGGCSASVASDAR